MLLLIAIFGLQGCAATQIALEKRDLKVETLMSQTVFLDVENLPARSVFINLRNTSGKDFELASKISDRLREKGYEVTANPREAGYLLQINVLQVGEADPIALRASVFKGYEGTLGMVTAGAGAGAMTGGSTKNKSQNALIGGLGAGAMDVIAGSLVKDVTFSVLTDVQVTERVAGLPGARPAPPVQTKDNGISSSSAGPPPTRHQTRIASMANQVNLKFNEALQRLQDGLADSICGIF